MDSDYYFFDQFSRASHVGGVYRHKRQLEDLNQALYHVKVSLSIDDDHELDRKESTTPSRVKQQTSKTTGDVFLQTILRKLKTAIMPEILTKQLDTTLQLFHDKFPPALSKSTQSIFVNNEQEAEVVPIQDDYDEDPLMAGLKNLPKVSLPGPLIVQLHSTWSDLIKNTEYKFKKVWRTKAGEDAWRQYIERKRFEQVNLEKQQYLTVHKQIPRHRISSRGSVTSSTNLSQRQSLTTNSKIRLNRSFSRASFLSTSNMIQDNLHLLKAMHHRNSEHSVEHIKNGIHVEFQLSTQIDEIQQKSQSSNFNEQKIVVFDIAKPLADLNDDIITRTQNKCKRLLAETKQKIDDSNIQNPNICRVWFYENKQSIRNKTNLLTLNESNRRQRSKFVQAILRREIPEKYNIDIQIPESKHKCYIELADGSSQIYYPSGRLAVLRLQSSFSTALFFDDTDSTANQFLGLVTSTGSVILMQPTFHARFVTDNRHERAYLCNGKTGIIEKQLQWLLTNNSQRQSIPIDEDDINPPLLDNIVQLQLNSFMQLEYHNPTNILFAFSCQNEEFKFQLGATLPAKPRRIMDLTKVVIATKKISGERKSSIKPECSNSTNSSESSTVQEKKQIKPEKLLDGQVNLHQLPMMQELILLRKRIKHICHSWLEECRTTLGIMDIDAYCLPDLPSQPILKQTKEQSDVIYHRHSAKHSRNIPILTKRASINKEFVQPVEKQLLLRKRSARKSEANVISNAIEHFVPHSDVGRTIKQRIFDKNKVITTTLPDIK